MDNKINCLAHFLNKTAGSIAVEDESAYLYRYEEKVFKIMTKQERWNEYNDYLLDHFHELPHDFLAPYILESLPPHMDNNEFSDYFFDLVIDLKSESNLLILSRINKLENFVNDSLKKNAHDNLGDIFADKDGKEHYSQSFQFYLYQVE